MKLRLPLLLLTLIPVSALPLISAPSAPVAAAQVLPTIFNGKDLKGWKIPTPNPFWRVEAGVLIGENDEKKTGSMLWTEKSYGDFVLELEARWEGEVDTGVMLRKPELQVQMGISRSLKRDMTGSFYVGGKGVAYPEAGRSNDAAKYLKPSDWNTFRIEARGTVFTVFINGHQTVQFTDAKYVEAAPIGLQVHPGLKMKVEFRNIRAAALP